jgi:Stage II sporulation protein M
VSAERLVLVRGLRDTGDTLTRWSLRPWLALEPWLAVSVGIALALLAAVWGIAVLSTPDATPIALPGVTRPASGGDLAHLLWRNSLVLALHSFACVAGFIARSSLPEIAATRTGLSRWVHEKAGPLAIAFVCAATAFSLLTQAYALGSAASSLAAQLGVSPGTLLVGLLPHALPELMALFLPLAAWLLASRRGAWSELLAATFVTTALAIPVLIASAMVELYLSPHLIVALAT